MSMEYLGDTFDIHGGGKDLIFPHHENEIAQSEGATGKPFVKYWLHNGFVNVNQEKMSKSLGNFFTIRDILKSYDPEVVRFFILTAHYRSPIDFSDQNLEEAKAGLSRFYEALRGRKPAEADGGCRRRAEECRREEGRRLSSKRAFREAMDDDFNTALAIGHLFDGVRAMNRLIGEKKFRKEADKVARRAGSSQDRLRLGGVLGLFGSDPAAWLEGRSSRALAGLGISAEEIEALIAGASRPRRGQGLRPRRPDPRRAGGQGDRAARQPGRGRPGR